MGVLQPARPPAARLRRSEKQKRPQDSRARPERVQPDGGEAGTFAVKVVGVAVPPSCPHPRERRHSSQVDGHVPSPDRTPRDGQEADSDGGTYLSNSLYCDFFGKPWAGPVSRLSTEPCAHIHWTLDTVLAMADPPRPTSGTSGRWLGAQSMRPS